MIETLLSDLISALRENTAALQGRVQTTLPLDTPAAFTVEEAIRSAAAPVVAPTLTPETPKRTRRTKAEMAAAATVTPETPASNVEKFPVPVVVPPEVLKAPEPAKPIEVTVDLIREVAHKLIDARRAKGLNPPNGPLAALNVEYGFTKVSDAAGTPKAAEVYAKIQAMLKEVA